MKIPNIKYPEIRNEIIQSLKFLIDKNIEDCINHQYPHSFWDNLRYPIGNLLDDLDRDENTEAQIGITLYDHSECDSVRETTILLNKLVKEIGSGKPDQVYLEWHLWKELVKVSKVALNFLNDNNDKYNFIHNDL